jgi:dipeptidyl aminopeptidase/acylaminoacyl peptidase
MPVVVEKASRVRYEVARYLNARTAYMPSFSPDGEKIAFLSDITGMPQLWQVDTGGGWPDQLSFTTDRIMNARYLHRQAAIIFGMDRGGNEREQLYAWRDGDISELAVDPAVMHYFGAASSDDRLVAYSDNRRHPAFFDIYLNTIDGSNEKCVYQQDGTNTVADWAPAADRLLLVRQVGALDSDLFELDLNSGEVTHLSPHNPPAVYRQPRYASDGRSVYLITDQASEFARLARLNLETLEITFLSPDDRDVEWISLSPHGRFLAMTINADGYSTLVIRSLQTGVDIQAPGLPAGVIGQVEWSGDSSKMAFDFQAPDLNLNIWLWELEAGSCRQVTHATCGGIPQSAFITPELVHYPTFDRREIPAFLYMPDTSQYGEKLPVVLYVHGGPEGQSRPTFNAVIQYFANQGFAVLAPNVRGSIGYGRTFTHLDDVEKRMDSVADLEGAAKWIASSHRFDGDRVAVMGGSYGGFMVLAALTTYPDLWAAGVDIVGIADFETFLRNTGAYRRHLRISEYGDPDIHADLFRRISPIHHVDRIRVPLLVIHGDNDPRVPVSEAEQMVAALRARGQDVELLRFADEGHGLVKLTNKLVAYPRIGEFLSQHLL